MVDAKSQEHATLLDVLIDGFEKNEIFGGFHWRNLPMPDEDAAARKFVTLMQEARAWKGQPARTHEQHGRRLAAWRDLEIRQAGRGIMVRVRAPRFDDWWHAKETWDGEPMAEIYKWIAEDRAVERVT
jgi:hypothetical protein